MAETTPIFGWSMPDQNTGTNWDATLNTQTFLDVENTIDGVKTTADAALPDAGGTLTGDVKTLTVSETGVDLGSSLSGTVDMDISAANNFYGTATGALTFTVSSPPASGDFSWNALELTDGEASGVTWPASFEWDGGSAPTLQTAGVDVIVFWTRDAGTTYRAVQAFTKAT